MASGTTDASAIAAAAAEAAIAHEIIAPSTTARIVNFNRGMVGRLLKSLKSKRRLIAIFQHPGGK